MKNNSTDSLQLSPVVYRSRSNSLVRPSDGQYSRQSEVYCNVRHMLNYIDQVEAENYRHAKAIEDQFQAIKHELYCSMRGEQHSVDSGSRLNQQNQLEPLFGEMERDLQLNLMAMNSIGKKLAQLRAQFKKTKQSQTEQQTIENTTPQKSKLLSLQYRTPLTNRIEHSPLATIEASAEYSVEQARCSATARSSSVEMPFRFKVPTFVPSIKKPNKDSANTKTKQMNIRRKRKLNQDENEDDDHEDQLKLIIDSTEFWRIDLDPNSVYDQRFANVIHGLPIGNPVEHCQSHEAYLKEVEEAIGWIDRTHVKR